MEDPLLQIECVRFSIYIKLHSKMVKIDPEDPLQSL